MTEPPATVAPVTVSLIVEVSPEHAFAVLADRIGTWWPRGHHTGEGELAEVRIEPRTGGRRYEISTDGREGEWGRMLAWEPPHRVPLGWQLDATFSYDPAFLTEVEVTFTAEGPGGTRVVLEHRDPERYGERSTELRDSLGGDGGRPSLLRSFVADTARGVALI